MVVNTKCIAEPNIRYRSGVIVCRLQRFFSQSLKDECRSLQAELGEISKVVKNNLQKFEDDLDVCKVIYTLHGSLSKVNPCVQEILYIKYLTINKGKYSFGRHAEKAQRE